MYNLKDMNQKKALAGGNPFDFVTFTKAYAKLSTVVQLYDPPYTDSTAAYKCIKDNISGWVEKAITRIQNTKTGK